MGKIIYFALIKTDFMGHHSSRHANRNDALKSAAADILQILAIKGDELESSVNYNPFRKQQVIKINQLIKNKEYQKAINYYKSIVKNYPTDNFYHVDWYIQTNKIINLFDKQIPKPLTKKIIDSYKE
jgi:hypothetical protein